MSIKESISKLPRATESKKTKQHDEHGEWIDWLGTGNEWMCPWCKSSYESHGSIDFKFCPMCGKPVNPVEPK